MDGKSELWTPPPGWRAEFERQLTREAMDRVTRYARRRVRLIERVGRKLDPLHARELVQDAVGDTLDGGVTWEPARAPLAAHLLGVVRSRTRHEVVRAMRSPHRSLDDSADDNSTDGRPLETEASHALKRHGGDRRREAIGLHGQRAVEALRGLAGSDRAVALLLDAYENEKTERAEVMAWTGMSAATYDNARRRMVRLVEKLPTELREIAAELLA